jgi:hypothetical protein
MDHSGVHEGMEALRRLQNAQGSFNIAMAAVDGAAAEVMRAQRLFVHTAGTLLADPDVTLCDQFDTPEAYYTTLAGLWGDGYKQREQPAMTAEVTEVVRALHTPGTLAFLMVRGRIPQLGEQFAVGTIADGTRPDIVQAPYSGEAKLVLKVPIRQVNGTNAVSEVGVSDISARRNRLSPGTSTPIVAVGQAAVAKEVLAVYPPLCQRIWFGAASVHEDDILVALCKGGLKLSELGVAQDRIDTLRQGMLRQLREACVDTGQYEGEILRLVPLFDTNQEALAAVNEVLEETGTPLNAQYLTGDVGRDYSCLVEAQLPKA